MKKWKITTISIFLSLNILLFLFTYSPVYQNYLNYEQKQSGRRNLVSEETKSVSLRPSLTNPTNRLGNVVGQSLRTSVFRNGKGNTDNTAHSSKFQSFNSERHQEILLALLNYILNPTNRCASNPKLIIAVCSTIGNFERREAIRSTWGNQTFLELIDTSIVFIVALPLPEDQHLQPYLIQEYDFHDDIVQLNHTDHYKNLSLKSIGMLRWTTKHCATTKFLLKADDDVFVNTPNLVHALQDANFAHKTDFVLGSVIQAAQPVRNRLSKWYTPYSVYRAESYPPYASGTAYLLSGDVVSKLLSASWSHSIFWLEDIFLTGILARELDVELLHDDRFNYQRKRKRHPCWFMTTFTEHDQSPKDLIKIWNFFTVNPTGLRNSSCHHSTFNYLV